MIYTLKAHIKRQFRNNFLTGPPAELKASRYVEYQCIDLKQNLKVFEINSKLQSYQKLPVLRGSLIQNLTITRPRQSVPNSCSYI